MSRIARGSRSCCNTACSRAQLRAAPPIRESRDLTRQRSQLVAEKAAGANRIQKVLEDANITLASVATDVLGVSGRHMLEALNAGEDDAEKLADRARKRLRKKIPQLQTALQGRVTAHHCFQLRILLDHVTHLEGLIGRLGVRIEELLIPFAEAVERLTTIPGVEQRAAETVIAAIGTDMKQFPTAEHLASWAGMCPGNNESAGKPQERQNDQRETLAAAGVDPSGVGGQSYQGHLSVGPIPPAGGGGGRSGALVALGHTLLVIIYHLLKDGTTYQELGGDFLERLEPERLTRQLVQRLEKLGHKVSLEPKDVA